MGQKDAFTPIITGDRKYSFEVNWRSGSGNAQPFVPAASKKPIVKKEELEDVMEFKIQEKLTQSGRRKGGKKGKKI